MKYTMNDNTAGGIYNGLDEFDLEPMMKKLASETGVERGDYDAWRISRDLSKDPEIMAEAERTFVRYEDGPLRVNVNNTGDGDVPDDMIERKMLPIFERIYQETVAPRLAKERQEETRRQEILSRVVKVETEERTILDEDGEVPEYIHTVYMPSGNTYRFVDRNVFDFGRALSYEGKLLVMRDGRPCWWSCSDVYTEASDDDEAVQAYRAASLYGHYDSGVRMWM